LIKFTVFDVGRGSSVLVELPDKGDGVQRLGVIDCYSGQSAEGPLLTRLNEIEKASNGNFSIEFFILTHLHTDHFLGIGDILRRHGSRIRCFYDPGIDPRDLFVTVPTDEAMDKRARRELRAISDFKNRHPSSIHAISSPDLCIYCDDLNGVDIRSVAPEGMMLDGVKKVLQQYILKLKRALEMGESLTHISQIAARGYDLNKTSSAIAVTYSGMTFLLGGDVLNQTWKIIADGGNLRKADVVLLSHHGADNAFPEKLWASIQNANGRTIISGRGRGQPAPSVLNYLRRRGASVWTTNIVKSRSGFDTVHSYIVAFHYGADAYSNVTRGNVICSMSSEVEITGPRLL